MRLGYCHREETPQIITRNVVEVVKSICSDYPAMKVEPLVGTMEEKVSCAALPQTPQRATKSVSDEALRSLGSYVVCPKCGTPKPGAYADDDCAGCVKLEPQNGEVEKVLSEPKEKALAEDIRCANQV